MDRRTFLQSAAAGAAALSAAAYAGAADKPNDRLRVAVMGVRGRGLALLRQFAARPDAEVVTVCDVDESVLAPAVKAAAAKTDRPVRTEKDIRKVLDDKGVDAVVIAAPDHWHAPATVWACQAGKDVYVEKPVSHNLAEGRMMVDAARTHKRVVQAGTQRRSGAQFRRAAEFLRGGGIGQVIMARSWIFSKRINIGRKADGPVPAGVDYDLWLGPAPQRAFNPNRFHYQWHWFWDYGTGELGNNGIHGLDIARWGMGAADPVRISSAGGKYFFTDDDQETPDTQVVTWDFAGCTLIWEHRTWYDVSKRAAGKTRTFGISWQGTKGTLTFDGEWKVLDGDAAFDPGPSESIEAAHVADFVEAVRSRRNPNADILEGHLSTRLCHLGNIAHRLGRTVRFDAANETIPGDAEAAALLGRTYREGFELPVRSA